jgi:hypothetical protein
VVLAVGGSAALVGTAHATATHLTAAQAATVEQGANGVIYGTGGTPQASYDATNNTWTLESPTSAGGSAQIDLVNPSSLLGPGDDNWTPFFRTSSDPAGDPRVVIEFHDGCSLVGTPGTGDLLSWSGSPGGPQSANWITATAWVYDTCGADDQVTAAYIEVTDSDGVPTTLSDVTYYNEEVVPYSATTTVSAQGQIKNRSSGKCLDVTGGQFVVGTKLQQYTCGASYEGVKGADQKFEIVTHDVNGAMTGYLEAVSLSGTVLYVSAPGGQLVLSATRSAETDMLESGGDPGCYTFPEAPGSTLATPVVMDDSGSGAANGNKIISYPLNYGFNQVWSMP